MRKAILYLIRQRQIKNAVIQNNLYSLNDAASPAEDETNTVTLSSTEGWSNNSSTNISSSELESQNGLYSVRLESLATQAIAHLNFVLEIGKTYRFTWYAKNLNSGLTGRLRQSGGFTANPPETYFDQTWKEYSVDLTVESTNCYLRFWTARSNTIGELTWIDDFRVIEL